MECTYRYFLVSHFHPGFNALHVALKLLLLQLLDVQSDTPIRRKKIRWIFYGKSEVKFSFFEKATKFFRNLPYGFDVRLLSAYVIVKTIRMIAKILWPSQKS